MCSGTSSLGNGMTGAESYCGFYDVGELVSSDVCFPHL